MLGILVFYFLGITTPEETFSGFNSSATWTLVGISLFSGAFFSSGLGAFLGQKIAKFCRGSEKICIVTVFFVVTILSGFVNGLAMYVMFKPLIDAVCAKSEGKIDVRVLSMVLSVSCLLGGSLSLMGASSILAVSGMYEEYSLTGTGFKFFETATLGIPMIIAGAIYYIFFYQKIANRFGKDFTASFSDNMVTEVPEKFTGKMWITLIVLIVSIICFVFTKLSMPVVCFTAAAVMMALGIVTEKEAVSVVPWHGTLCMICMLGFAKGVEVSGAGELIGNGILNAAQAMGIGPFGICVLVLLTATIVSNFMSNNAAVTVTMPIAMSIAVIMDADPLPFAVATAVGANAAFATPMAAPLLTMNLSTGYKFKHYLLLNGPVNIMTFIAGVIGLKIFYFM